MRRREFVAGLVVATRVRRAHAQAAGKGLRIGMVSPINMRSAPQFSAFEGCANWGI